MNEISTNPQAKSPAPSAPGATPAERERHPLETLRRSVDRLFEDFDHGFPRSFFTRPWLDFEGFGGRAWLAAPAVDVIERDRDYQIIAEVPGMEQSHLDVQIANGILAIRGEKKEEKQENQKHAHLSERRFGSFERLFRIPEGVDRDKIDAHFKAGVLTVTLPKTAEAREKERKISVKAD
jgi:HSP20 family protein